MTFRVEQKGRKLSVSPWRDQGKVGVFVSISEDGESKSVLLSFAEAEALVESMDDMLDDLEVEAA